MLVFIALVLGLAAGAVCTFIVLMTAAGRSQDRLRQAAATEARALSLLADYEEKEQGRLAREQDLAERLRQGETRLTEINRRHVKYEELAAENGVLKRDLRNVDVNLNKLSIDGELRTSRLQEVERQSNELGKRYLADTVKFIGGSLTPSNFTACKDRLLDVIRRCRVAGFQIAKEEEAGLVDDMRADFEKAVRLAFAREEQARVKAQIREDERLKRETERELAQLDRERLAIKTALDRALADANNQHTDEVNRLEARLAEAEEKSRRALSMAQQTKAGHVYIISNLGSFGDGVFKVGMTRRLEPMERVKELCTAAVPFPFDVHMMAHCDDAPALENALHRELHRSRVNKMNPRKEFFRTDIENIKRVVAEHCGTVEFTADAAAIEYRQSQEMSDADADYISGVYDQIDDDEDAPDANP